jgi:hypothetical protein
MTCLLNTREICVPVFFFFFLLTLLALNFDAFVCFFIAFLALTATGDVSFLGLLFLPFSFPCSPRWLIARNQSPGILRPSWSCLSSHLVLLRAFDCLPRLLGYVIGVSAADRQACTAKCVEMRIGHTKYY